MKPSNTTLGDEASGVIIVAELTLEVRRLCELRSLMRAARRDTSASAEHRVALVGMCHDLGDLP